MLGQGFRLLSAFAVLFGLGSLTLTLDADLLGLLSLGQLGFHELQLFLQTADLCTILCYLCCELADLHARGFNVAAGGVELLPVRPTGVLLPFAAAYHEPRHGPQNRDDDDQRQYLNHIIEHMF